MTDATKRSILRSIHIVFAIPIIGYIYSPFKELPNYAPVVRFVAFPVIALIRIVDVERPSPSTTYLENSLDAFSSSDNKSIRHDYLNSYVDLL